MRSSLTTTVRPRASKISRAADRSAPEAASPAASAAAPSPTRAGVLGMTRTMGTPFFRRSAMNRMGMPAAMETTSFLRSMTGASSPRTSPIPCGLTARITMSASRAAFRLSSAVPTAYLPFR